MSTPATTSLWSCTRADKRRSRRGEPEPSPVKLAAEELGLPVTHSLDDVAGVGAELGVVVAFGRIVPEAVLDRLPMVNVHFSMLPRWRGAAPVEWAILEGDAETGVCLMAVEAGLDTGPVYACEPAVIGEDESADDLRDRLVVMGSGLLRRYLAEGWPVCRGPGTREGHPFLRGEDRAGYSSSCIGRSRPCVSAASFRLGRAWTTFRGHRLRVLRGRRPAPARRRADVPAGHPRQRHGHGARPVPKVVSGSSPCNPRDDDRCRPPSGSTGRSPTAGERLGA